MQRSVTGRHVVRNTMPASLSPMFCTALAGPVGDPARLAIVLQGEHRGTLDGARRHALTLLGAAVGRFPRATAEVRDIAGKILFTAHAEGGAS